MAKRCGKFHGNYMIQRIVGRLHVGTPEDEAVGYVKSRLAPGAWDTLSSKEQRDFECEVRRAHRENLDLYLAVSSGRFR